MALSFALGPYSSSVICRTTNINKHSHAQDLSYIRRAADLSDKSAGFTSPHPNFGCVIATRSGEVAGEGYLYAQGTKPAEGLAVEAAGERCRGATAYLNMEPGDCHWDHTAVSALVQVSIFGFFFVVFCFCLFKMEIRLYFYYLLFKLFAFLFFQRVKSC